MRHPISISRDLLARMRTDAEAIFRAALKASDPVTAIHAACRVAHNHLYIHSDTIDLSRPQRIVVVGAGKATAGMAHAMESLLKGHISDGLICVKYGHARSLARIGIIEAGHPLPDANGAEAARRIMNLVARTHNDDLIIVLLSGGGSALIPLPVAGITLAEKQATTDLLLACGATIHEINAVRKHLSAIKGGHLAQAAAPTPMVVLVLSDVVGDDLDVIASGPTVPDPTRFEDCIDIIERHGIAQQLPRRVYTFLKAGAEGRQRETPKPETHDWRHVRNCIVGSNALAIQAAGKEAQKRGYRPLVLTSELEGEARTVARVHAAIARQVGHTGQPVAPPACLLSGGETTVVLKGTGKGGRNQEFALAAAPAIDGALPIVVLSAGTDGTDGPTDAAGAFADPTTVQRAAGLGLDIRQHLADNNAYPFFNTLGDLLVTGPTGTNVMDLNVILIKPSS